MLDIIDVPLPASAEHPHWQAYCRLNREQNHELLGTAEWDDSPEEALAGAAADTEHTMRRYLALTDGEAVGCARSITNHVDDPEAVALAVFVRPGARGQGVGRPSPNASCRTPPARPASRRGPSRRRPGRTSPC